MLMTLTVYRWSGQKYAAEYFVWLQVSIFNTIILGLIATFVNWVESEVRIVFDQRGQVKLSPKIVQLRCNKSFKKRVQLSSWLTQNIQKTLDECSGYVKRTIALPHVLVFGYKLLKHITKNVSIHKFALKSCRPCQQIVQNCTIMSYFSVQSLHDCAEIQSLNVQV